MRIDHLLAAGPTRSFEYMPPKTDEEANVLAGTLRDLEGLAPSFVSVTYRGGRESRERTFDLVTTLQRDTGVTAMAHLICVGHSRAEMRDVLERYLAADVVNLMLLGGDIPSDPGLVASEFEHALDLVEFARGVGEFSIGVAAHPAGHPRSPDLASDRRHLATKLAAADFAVTQFFFAASDWTRLVEDLAAHDVHRPVLPGIMPVTTLASIDRMAIMGAAVPPALAERLRTAHDRGGPAAIRAEGIAAATELCRELLDAGAPGIHFYTLNRSTATREIHEALFDGDGVRRP